MTIQQALQDPILQVRLSCGDRWLVSDEEGNYTVFERPYGAKKTWVLIRTTNESEAVAVLTNTVEEKS